MLYWHVSEATLNNSCYIGMFLEMYVMELYLSWLLVIKLLYPLWDFIGEWECPPVKCMIYFAPLEAWAWNHPNRSQNPYFCIYVECIYLF